MLTGALPPPGEFDLVSCRNLLGYFRGASLDAAITNVFARAKKGGVLLLDPFVADAKDMAQAQARIRAAGLKRRWPGLSFFDVPSSPGS